MLRRFAFAALLACAATAAQAETPTFETQVAYGDLNISRPEGAKVLASRLETAAWIDGRSSAGITRCGGGRSCCWPYPRCSSGELPATIFTAIRPWISPDSVLSCWTNVVG